jgi:DNA-binding NarL/FixJ family response regulator
MFGQRPSPGSGRDSDDPVATRGRVIVAEDDVLLREGLARLLVHNGYDVVGRADNGVRLLELVAEHVPDLVVVDNRMPPSRTTEGIWAAQKIRAEHPLIGILVLSGYIEVGSAIDLLTSGDRFGYLLKSHVLEVSDLVDTLERIAAGGSVIDRSLVTELLATHQYGEPLAELSSDDCGMLGLVAEGRTDIDIARKLETTVEAVESHVRRIFAQLCLPEPDCAHRRVLATLAFLDTCGD